MGEVKPSRPGYDIMPVDYPRAKTSGTKQTERKKSDTTCRVSCFFGRGYHSKNLIETTIESTYRKPASIGGSKRRNTLLTIREANFAFSKMP